MNKLERDFLAALNATTSYELSGQTLEVLDGTKSLARFSAKE